MQSPMSNRSKQDDGLDCTEGGRGASVRFNSLSNCRWELTTDYIYFASAQRTLVPRGVAEQVSDNDPVLQEYTKHLTLTDESNKSTLVNRHRGNTYDEYKQRIADLFNVYGTSYRMFILPAGVIEYILSRLVPNSLWASYDGIFSNSFITGRYINRYIVADSYLQFATEQDFKDLFNIQGAGEHSDKMDTVLYAGHYNPEDGMIFDYKLTDYLKHQLNITLVFDLSFGAFSGNITYPNSADILLLDLDRFFTGLPAVLLLVKDSRIIDPQNGPYTGRINHSKGGVPPAGRFSRGNITVQTDDTAGSTNIMGEYPNNIMHLSTVELLEYLDLSTPQIMRLLYTLLECVTMGGGLSGSGLSGPSNNVTVRQKNHTVGSISGSIDAKQLDTVGVTFQMENSKQHRGPHDAGGTVIGSHLTNGARTIPLAELLRQELGTLFAEYQTLQIMGGGTPYVVLRFLKNKQEAQELYRFLLNQRVISRLSNDKIIFDLALYNTQADIEDLLAVIEQYKSFIGLI